MTATKKQTITTGPDQKPPPHSQYGDTYERGLDPWHVDAFPAEFKKNINALRGPRRSGWFLKDGYGNDVVFVPDGTTFEL